MREIEIELHEAAANNKASVVKILLNNKNIDINLYWDLLLLLMRLNLDI